MTVPGGNRRDSFGDHASCHLDAVLNFLERTQPISRNSLDARRRLRIAQVGQNHLISAKIRALLGISALPLRAYDVVQHTRRSPCLLYQFDFIFRAAPDLFQNRYQGGKSLRVGVRYERDADHGAFAVYGQHVTAETRCQLDLFDTRKHARK